MTILDYPNFKFFKKDTCIKVVFKIRYYFEIPLSELTDIEGWDIIDTKFILENEDKYYKRIDNLVDKFFRSGLTHNLNKKKVVYINRESEIPLIGSNEFGIVDRNSSLIEVKPLTGCNFNCTFCSVDEGINDKLVDYLVDVDYLLEEVEKLVKIKSNPIEINIGPQGEPLLYPDIVKLIDGLKKIDKIYFVSLNSNGSLLNKPLIDDLEKAGLGRINLSIHSINNDKSKKLMGDNQNQDFILKMCDYAKNKFEIMLCPVIMKRINDSKEEIDGLVNLSRQFKKEYPYIGFQNYLRYKGGRKGAKEMSFDIFYDKLKASEKRTETKLLMDASDFKIVEDKVLEKPFQKGEVIQAPIVCKGRFPGEQLAALKDRIITVRSCTKDKGILKIKIQRDKHNIFTGMMVR